MVMTNQSIQLDPFLAFFRLVARLQQYGCPNYDDCIHTINEIKKKAKTRQLSAALLYMLVRPFLFPIKNTNLENHIKKFFNMLIENKLLEYHIGPPYTTDTNLLPDEKKVWPTAESVQKDVQIHITVANQIAIDQANQPRTPGVPADKVKVKFTAGKLNTLRFRL